MLAEVEQAVRTGDLPRAFRLADAALAQGHTHPLLFDLRARRAEMQGRLPDALAELGSALALAPDDADLHHARALLLSRMGRGREALADFARVVALRPGFALAWRNCGMTQIGEGDVAGARASLQQAMALAPADAEPPGQLAVLAARRGDWAEAERLAAAALALDPALPSAVRALAEADMRAGRLDAAGERLEKWLRRPKATPPARRLALGLLGDVRERQGRYDEAFAIYAATAAETRRRHAGGAGRADLRGAIARLQAGAEAVSDWPPAPAPPPQPPARHVFLMGFMRSGTTLIEQALATRDDVVGLEEQEALTLGVERYFSAPDGLQQLQQAGAEELDGLRADYWSRVRGFGVEPQGRVFIDKNPFNGIKLPLIARLFPQARIVFSVRQPQDVVLSCFKHRFAVNSYTYQLLDLATAAAFYDAYMRLVRTYLDRLPLDVLVYRHEDLVQDYAGVLGRIVQHLRLDWREGMRDVGLRVREGRVSSPSAVQLRDGLSRDGLQAWRRYARHLAPVQPLLQPWAEAFGYADDPPG